jgi:hypothetical protein
LTARRARAAAALLLLALAGLAFTGRAVLSSDGADMTSETLGFLVLGKFENASLPPAKPDPWLPTPPPFHSRYGLFPSLVPLPLLGAAWPLRGHVGAAWIEGFTALTWTAGALFASLAFLALARRLKPDATPLWAPAFLAGTFLWPYASDSFMEPFSAAALGVAAAAILGAREEHAARSGFLAGTALAAACLLRPILWTCAPVFGLALLLEWRGKRRSTAAVLGFGAAAVAGLLAAALANFARYGKATELGYGFKGGMPFLNPLLEGLLELTFHPGRGVFLYAPIALAALFAARKLGAPARVLSYGVPAAVLLVVCRWYGWHGGSAWGPRYMLMVLPLLAAPAVLLPRAVSASALALGVLVNLPGVVVAPGAWVAYAELLKPPPGADWPAPGGDRMSTIPALTPLYGHVFLLGEGAGIRMPRPWESLGASASVRLSPAEFVSPWILRRALSYPPIYPMLPRLLARMAQARAVYGRTDEAERLAREALRIDPQAEPAKQLLDALPAPRGPVSSGAPRR